MKIFISGFVAEITLDLLAQNNFTITQWKEERQISEEELIAQCKQHDALISVGPNNLNEAFLRACSHLKVIALHSVGFDQVDVDVATQLGIKIGNTPGVLSGATADVAFLLMLAVSRKAFYMHKKILNGNWLKYDAIPELGIELNGKTLGVFGMGKIGLEMAKKCAAAYNMKIIYHNRNKNEEAENLLSAQWVSFDELLKSSDVLSLHTALTLETKNKFTIDVFRKMKTSSIFINTARGAMHNEKDLIKALNEGLIWGAGLDVTNPEPMDLNNPLLNMENVAVLPHIGSATEETRTAMGKLIAENIIAGLTGQALPHPVN